MADSKLVKKPFRIGTLPAVCKRRILEFMDKLEYMFLANCSAKTAEWVRAETVKAPVMKITLRLSSGISRLDFSSSTHSERYRFSDPNGRPPKNQPYRLATDPLAQHCNEKWRKRALEKTDALCTYMTSLVLNTYQSQLANLDVDLKGIDVSETLSKIKVSTCEHLRLWGVSSATQHKLQLLLDTIKVTGTLTFLSNPGIDFNYQKPFRVPHLNVQFAKWFTRANLLMSNCETISLTHSKLECRDLNTFVRQWKQGQYKKLKKLEIRQENDIHVECVVKGLEAKMIERDRVKEYDEETAKKYLKGFEIQRRNGQKAAVLLGTTEYFWQFFFLVL